MSDIIPRPRLRLFVEVPLSAGNAVALEREQTHYLSSVMRAEPGENVLLFNGADGEWLARIDRLGRPGGILIPELQVRPQSAEPEPRFDPWLLAAPLKRDRTDLVAEKVAELGASLFWPVFTRRTVANRVNGERLRARMIEAAEQCERLTLPLLNEAVPLERVLANWPEGRTLLFLDETGGGEPLAEVAAGWSAGPVALLVGPEGGFAPEERALLVSRPFVRPVGLGPRILRAETATIAALALWQALAGDGDRPPRG
ncbi:16S rRNA (uracil(1498)-N(3))-methyltransferase [Magnetospirillum fulvum]|uniref:Ribosomal RNA small subunit methyltransferase E n=1 Tax=Magnetospirillum fulvum TaxID=1082 RepID=A0A1H6J4T1_MAGFU|nr:16S rRNA (uracil(1498)-N(3))-methyltransferase [Magnetospirillum fulvum]SEH57086.1 16S rRNA (uracil1498-N3)-methyltransferase [Magnetospirillum fulvum]